MRFPGFEGEWKCSKLSAYLYENKERNRAGEFNKSDVLSVSGDCGIVNQIELLGRSFAGKSVADYHIVRTGNIVYTKSPLKEYPYGIVKYNSGKDGIVSTLYAVYHHRENVNGRFVEHYFTSPQRTNKYFKPIVRIGAKHDMKIGNNEVLDNTVLFPGLKEQNRITELLDLLDQRIAIQNKVIEDLKKLKTALNDKLHQQFGYGQAFSFSEIGDSYSGLSGKSSEDFGDGAPFVTYTNIYTNDIVDENDYGYVRINDKESQNHVQYGDLLFTLSSETPDEVGVGSVYLGSSKELYLNSFSFGIHIKRTDVIFPPYLAHLVSSSQFRRFIYPFAQGSTRYNLQKHDFETTKYSFPIYENQIKICSVLDSIAKKIAYENDSLLNWRKLKQCLLYQLFI